MDAKSSGDAERFENMAQEYNKLKKAHETMIEEMKDKSAALEAAREEITQLTSKNQEQLEKIQELEEKLTAFIPDDVRGTWSHGTIDGQCLLWDGDELRSELIECTRTSFKISHDGEELSAELQPDGKLLWSDGDVWERISQVRSTAQQAALDTTLYYLDMLKLVLQQETIEKGEKVDSLLTTIIRSIDDKSLGDAFRAFKLAVRCARSLQPARPSVTQDDFSWEPTEGPTLRRVHRLSQLSCRQPPSAFNTWSASQRASSSNAGETLLSHTVADNDSSVPS